MGHFENFTYNIFLLVFAFLVCTVSDGVAASVTPGKEVSTLASANFSGTPTTSPDVSRKEQHISSQRPLPADEDIFVELKELKGRELQMMKQLQTIIQKRRKVEFKIRERSLSLPPSDDTAETGYYTIRYGDTLWGIANVLFGDPLQWGRIALLNEYLPSPDILFPGQILRVPVRLGEDESHPDTEDAPTEAESLSMSENSNKAESGEIEEEVIEDRLAEPSAETVLATEAMETASQTLEELGFLEKGDIITEKNEMNLEAANISDTSIDLSWDAPLDADMAVGYNIYQDGAFLKSVTGTSFTQEELTPETSYCYDVMVVNDLGKETGMKEAICTTTLPSAPRVDILLAVRVENPTTVELKWTHFIKDLDISAFNVYQNGRFLRAVKTTRTTITELEGDKDYCFAVTALDPAGMEYAHSGENCLSTEVDDKLRPEAPTGLSVASLESNQVDISWDGAFDDKGVVGYNIYKDGIFMKAVASTSAFNVNLGEINAQESDSHCFTVSALDGSGNESRKSQQFCLTPEGTKRSMPGTLWASGDNRLGQLGIEGPVHTYTFHRVGENHEFMRISGGYEHTLALQRNGTVWSWGQNRYGQLGVKGHRKSTAPVKVKLPVSVKDIDAGYAHSLALAQDGTVWAWGRNRFGQLGTGSIADSTEPIRIEGLTNIKSVTACWYHSAAVGVDGSVWIWGWNHKSQLGLLNETGRNVDIVKRPSKLETLHEIEKVVCGSEHTVALQKDGTLWVWGRNEYGQLGSGNTLNIIYPVQAVDLNNIEDIAAGMFHTVALKQDGTVWAWGRNNYGQVGGEDNASVVTRPYLLKNLQLIQRVAAGTEHSLALQADGTVVAWGKHSPKLYSERYNPLPNKISGLTGLVAIDGGRHYTLVIKGN